MKIKEQYSSEVLDVAKEIKKNLIEYGFNIKDEDFVKNGHDMVVSAVIIVNEIPVSIEAAYELIQDFLAFHVDPLKVIRELSEMYIDIAEHPESL